jgi:nitroimidazol reductase NimA-like FMN-containing flavoprotein (pyridoxamine 5'-phosphate oxidase superfamily)
MRRAEYEITNLAVIAGILERCDTIRVGIHGGEYPYVVPFSYGYEMADGKLVLFVHGAKEGMKHDFISRNNKVCVEADIFYRYTKRGPGTTTEYESVIGFGTAEIAGRDDSVKGLDLLMKHCKTEGDAAQCVALGITTVYKITLDSVTGKINKIV